MDDVKTRQRTATYLRSARPRFFEDLGAREAAVNEARARSMTFAKEVAGPDGLAYGWQSLGRFEVEAIGGFAEPPAGWTQVGDGLFEPDPGSEHRHAFDALRAALHPVGSLPEIVLAADSLSTLVVFGLDGYTYAAYGVEEGRSARTVSVDASALEGWEEIAAGEWTDAFNEFLVA